MVPMLYGGGVGSRYLWRVDPTYDSLRVPFMGVVDSCYEQLCTIARVGLVYAPDRPRCRRSSCLLRSNLSFVGWGLNLAQSSLPPHLKK